MEMSTDPKVAELWESDAEYGNLYSVSKARKSTVWVTDKVFGISAAY